MTDDISKVAREMRERVVAARDRRTMIQRAMVLDWADRLESATTPAEVGEVSAAVADRLEEYSYDASQINRGALHDAATYIRTLARQLAEAKADAAKAEHYISAAEEVARIYFDIASEAIGEVEVRRIRDDRIVSVASFRKQLAAANARMLELEAQRDDYLNREWIAEKAKRKAESALAAVTRRVAEVDGLLREWMESRWDKPPVTDCERRTVAYFQQKEPK